MKFRNFLPAFFSPQPGIIWPGDAHTLLLGSGSFVALMVAGLITSARGPPGLFEIRV